MQKNLYLGVEAVGQGAIDGGLSGVYAYPGTPSTEITEYIQASKTAIENHIHRTWSTNEKTAYESALGMSYGGKRALVCMKHVGLNVAADPFMNSAITGVHGGLVLAVADDMSMHSSQNEQDSRFYGKFAQIPVFEPSSQQEAYDMVYQGFELSETLHLPVMVRMTTRLAHSRAGVIRKPGKPENAFRLPENRLQFMLLPAYARESYKALLEKQKILADLSEESVFNSYIDGPDKSLGILCCGLGMNYLMEHFLASECPYPVVKISVYPVPVEKIKKLESACDEILILEEGYPLVEEMVKNIFGKGKRILGRLDGTIPRSGELNPDIVRQALGRKMKVPYAVPEWVKNRPPVLCPGCGHQDLFIALKEVLEDIGDGHVFSDIGCYTLGVLPPYNMGNTCVDMGASITMGKGAADAGLYPVFSVIGDSTFTHSGMTGLLDAVLEKANINVIILDNEAVAMTGGQDSSASGKLEQICAALGVDDAHIQVTIPLKKNHEEMVRIIRKEMEYPGVSVVIARRKCIQKLLHEKKMKKTKKNPDTEIM
jgi:indolepyruvate ferredoxin oxidoreductase, alpha subunit